MIFHIINVRLIKSLGWREIVLFASLNVAICLFQRLSNSIQVNSSLLEESSSKVVIEKSYRNNENSEVIFLPCIEPCH